MITHGDARFRSNAVDSATLEGLQLLQIPLPALKGNLSGEATSVTVAVHDETGGEPAPLVVVLPGAGGGLSHWLASPNGPVGIVRHLDDRRHNMRVAFVDGGTALGGTQWINSAAGRWGDALRELIEQLVVLVGGSEVGLVGKSSGGYGTVMAAIAGDMPVERYAALAPDCGFTAAFGPFVQRLAAHALQSGVDPSSPEAIPKLWRKINGTSSLTKDDMLDAVVVMCATSFHQGLEPCLPVNVEGKLAGVSLWPDVDPVEIVARLPAPPRHELLLAVGDADEFFLTEGVRRLHDLWPGSSLREIAGGHAAVDALFPDAIMWAAGM